LVSRLHWSAAALASAARAQSSGAVHGGAGVFQDNVYCHITSGLGAGFVAVCVGSPVDVVKSRMMGALQQ
jgi:hypothetical protein